MNASWFCFIVVLIGFAAGLISTHQHVGLALFGFVALLLADQIIEAIRGRK